MACPAARWLEAGAQQCVAPRAEQTVSLPHWSCLLDRTILQNCRGVTCGNAPGGTTAKCECCVEKVRGQRPAAHCATHGGVMPQLGGAYGEVAECGNMVQCVCPAVPRRAFSIRLRPRSTLSPPWCLSASCRGTTSLTPGVLDTLKRLVSCALVSGDGARQQHGCSRPRRQPPVKAEAPESCESSSCCLHGVLLALLLSGLVTVGAAAQVSFGSSFGP